MHQSQWADFGTFCMRGQQPRHWVRKASFGRVPDKWCDSSFYPYFWNVSGVPLHLKSRVPSFKRNRKYHSIISTSLKVVPMKFSRIRLSKILHNHHRPRFFCIRVLAWSNPHATWPVKWGTGLAACWWYFISHFAYWAHQHTHMKLSGSFYFRFF